MGPEIEYTAQDAGGPIELRIYSGEDGDFDLYEDAGDSYDYEKGQHSVIPIHWNESTGVLTIGEREGSFPGMVATRQFRVVLVANGHGVGEAVTTDSDLDIAYDGRQEKRTLHR